MFNFSKGSLRSHSSSSSDSNSLDRLIAEAKERQQHRERDDSDRGDPTIPKALRAKEYPDFDYRYTSNEKNVYVVKNIQNMRDKHAFLNCAFHA